MSATMEATPSVPFGHPTTITLQNPETNNFASFIFGNACHCDRVVEKNSALGKTVVICGAGPSLRETASKWCAKGDQVWGCNSAATWLHDNGYPVTHAFTVDQTPQMCREWHDAPDIEYLLASSVHPHLTEYLMGKERRITYFHNYVGLAGRPVSYAVCCECEWMGDADVTTCPKCQSQKIDSNTVGYEDWLYTALYPSTVVTGSGLNATTRAIDLALFMGFAKIIVLGADCALVMKQLPPTDAPMGSPKHLAWLREHTVMHADGGSALASEASSMTLRGEIAGREWLSKPDLLVTAVWLRSMKKALGSRLSIMGDTLPKALLAQDDAFIARLPTLVGADGKVLEFCLPPFMEEENQRLLAQRHWYSLTCWTRRVGPRLPRATKRDR